MGMLVCTSVLGLLAWFGFVVRLFVAGWWYLVVMVLVLLVFGLWLLFVV